mgnify:CR=1 FL=1
MTYISENGEVTLLIDPEVLELEKQVALELAQRLKELDQELYDIEMEEIIFEVIAPNGECLRISGYDYQHYKRGTIKKFVERHRYD